MLVNIVILIFFIFLKFIFSACESSFTYVNKYVISQKSKNGNRRARKIKKMLNNKNKLFGTIKVGITLIEFLMSAYAAKSFIDGIKDLLSYLPLDVNTVSNISIVILTLILSYFSIIFGDMIPRKIGKANPEKVINILIYPLWLVSIILYPFEYILNKSTKFFVKALGLSTSDKSKLTEQELKYIISESVDDGLINGKSKQILLNTLKFDDLVVKDVMIKRDKVDFIDITLTPKQLIANLKKYNFTRMPVYEEKIDNIIGILNVKDILFAYSNKVIKDELNIKPLLRKPFFVSKEEKIEDVFGIMKLNAISMAIVVDKNSQVEGIVTLEDIIEKLVGNIFDEFDKIEK